MVIVNSIIKKMPVPLMLIAIVGLIAPVVMVLSAWGELRVDKVNSITLIDFLIVCVCALVVFLSSVGLYLRGSCARWFYLLGWVMTCLSPLLKKDGQDDLMLIIPPMILNLLIGLGLFLYLIRSNEVRAYFTKT